MKFVGLLSTYILSKMSLSNKGGQGKVKNIGFDRYIV